MLLFLRSLKTLTRIFIFLFYWMWVCTFFLSACSFFLNRVGAFGEQCDYNNSKTNNSQRELGFLFLEWPFDRDLYVQAAAQLSIQGGKINQHWWVHAPANICMPDYLLWVPIVLLSYSLVCVVQRANPHLSNGWPLLVYIDDWDLFLNRIVSN